MIFAPDLAQLVVTGHKTVTRRPRREGEPCRYTAGNSYAVQPGRGQNGIGRILVTDVSPGLVVEVDTVEEARREGFPSPREFRRRWRSMYPDDDGYLTPVWRIEFKLMHDAIVPASPGAAP